MPGLDPNHHPSNGAGNGAARPFPLDPGYILIEAMLQLSSRVHFDSGLYKGEVKLEITQEEALRLAPMLMPTIQKLMEEELPEELENLLLDEMNDRAVRALSEIPQGEYTALAEATLKRIHQEDSTRTWRQEAPPLDSPDDGKLAKATLKRIHQEDSTKTWIQEAPPPDSPDDGKPVNEHSFRLLISSTSTEMRQRSWSVMKCQKVLMDTGPGFDTETPEGVRCDHTNSTNPVGCTWEKTAPKTWSRNPSEHRACPRDAGEKDHPECWASPA